VHGHLIHSQVAFFQHGGTGVSVGDEEHGQLLCCCLGSGDNSRGVSMILAGAVLYIYHCRAGRKVGKLLGMVVHAPIQHMQAHGLLQYQGAGGNRDI